MKTEAKQEFKKKQKDSNNCFHMTPK